MARKKQNRIYQDQSQPYDNLLKSLLEGQEKQMLPYFLPGVEYLDTLNVEVVRTPLRVDRVYKVLYNGQTHILHLEFETGANNRMDRRLLDYHGYLHYKYGYPVISIIVYPFQTTMAQSPYLEESGPRALLIFHFLVLPLWECKAKQYMQEQALGMYALLPAMQGADVQLLNRAIDEMIEYHREDNARLAQELRWMGIVLRRADIVPLEEKRIIEERLNMFDDLMEKDPKMQKIRAESEAKGRAEGIAEGKAEGLQVAVMILVENRFPPLVELAQQKVMHVKKPDMLDFLLKSIKAAPDENVARRLLELIAA